LDAEGYEQVMLLVKNQVTKTEDSEREEGVSFADLRRSVTDTVVKQTSRLVVNKVEEQVKDEGVSFADLRNSVHDTEIKQQSRLIVKNEVATIEPEEGTSFADIRDSLTEKTIKQKKNELKTLPEVVEKAVPAPTVGKNINKDTIRPSHIKSEHILYKLSGYLKDLIGEEK
jgi:hypothetical protein